MREVHGLPGPKRRVEADGLVPAILAAYPQAHVEGSPGALHAAVEGEMVAEAWVSRKLGWWWLRLRE